MNAQIPNGEPLRLGVCGRWPVWSGTLRVGGEDRGDHDGAVSVCAALCRLRRGASGFVRFSVASRRHACTSHVAAVGDDRCPGQEDVGLCRFVSDTAVLGSVLRSGRGIRVRCAMARQAGGRDATPLRPLRKQPERYGGCQRRLILRCLKSLTLGQSYLIFYHHFSKGLNDRIYSQKNHRFEKRTGN